MGPLFLGSSIFVNPKSSVRQELCLLLGEGTDGPEMSPLASRFGVGLVPSMRFRV